MQIAINKRYFLSYVFGLLVCKHERIISINTFYPLPFAVIYIFTTHKRKMLKIINGM